MVMDQLDKKVEHSKTKLKRRKARRGAWDDINGTGIEGQRKAASREMELDVEHNSEWEDEAEDSISREGSQEDLPLADVSLGLAGTRLELVDRTASTLGTDDEDAIT